MFCAKFDKNLYSNSWNSRKVCYEDNIDDNNNDDDEHWANNQKT